MKVFDQIFTLETDRSREEIINKLNRKNQVIVSEDSFTVKHNPPWFNLFAARGLVTFFMQDSKAGNATMQCRITPSIADAKTIAVFLLCNIPLSLLIIYLFPWSVLLIGLFILEWFMMAFVAIPILIAILLAATIYIIIQSFTLPGLFFIIICWSFILLLINATLRFNRGELKKWVIRTIA